MKPILLFITLSLSLSAIFPLSQSAEQPVFVPSGYIPVEINNPHLLRVSPDGRFLAVATGRLDQDDGQLEVWALPANERLFSRDFSLSYFGTMSWTPDGNYLMYAVRLSESFPDNSENRDTRDTYGLLLWEVSTQAETTLVSNISEIFGFDVHPESRQVALNTGDEGLQVIAIPSGEVLFQTQLRTVNTPQFSPDGTWLAGVSYETGLMLWDTDAYHFQQAFPLDTYENLQFIQWSPDSHRLAVALTEDVIDITSGMRFDMFSEWGNGLTDHTWSPDSRYVYSPVGFVFDTQTQTYPVRLPRQYAAQRDSSAWTSDGRYLVTMHQNQDRERQQAWLYIEIRDTQTWEVVQEVGREGSDMVSMALLPDNTLLLGRLGGEVTFYAYQP